MVLHAWKCARHTLRRRGCERSLTAPAFMALVPGAAMANGSLVLARHSLSTPMGPAFQGTILAP